MQGACLFPGPRQPSSRRRMDRLTGSKTIIRYRETVRKIVASSADVVFNTIVVGARRGTTKRWKLDDHQSHRESQRAPADGFAATRKTW